MSSERWDRFYLGMADYIASASKDPSTKVGAVVVRPDKTVASLGFNGFPRGMRDDPDLYMDRETKYSRIIHAEINAILNAKEPLTGYTLYVTHHPCDRCAVQIVQAGIRRVVTWLIDARFGERWPQCALAWDYLHEAGVSFHYVNRSITEA